MRLNEIDKNILPLVQVLNKFEGVRTVGSCGGHDSPKPGQYPKNSWYVKFGIEKNDWGWIVLEFLAWIGHDLSKAKKKVLLYPTSPPPYLNEPGECLSFVFEGEENPLDIANFFEECFGIWKEYMGSLYETGLRN